MFWNGSWLLLLRAMLLCYSVALLFFLVNYQLVTTPIADRYVFPQSCFIDCRVNGSSLGSTPWDQGREREHLCFEPGVLTLDAQTLDPNPKSFQLAP